MVRSVLLATTVALLPLGLQAQDRPTITVSGEGKVAHAPDMAMIDIGVTAEDPLANVALTTMSEQLAKVQARLTTVPGIAAEDLQTSNLSLSPRYKDGKYGDQNAILGFVASSTLHVRVKQLDQLGGLLDQVVQDGANTLGGLRFDILDPAPLVEEARRAAVADARARAELYAEAAGVTLGPVIEIRESGGYGRPQPEMMMYARAAADSGVPIAQGEVSLSASVSMVYQIAD